MYQCHSANAPSAFITVLIFFNLKENMYYNQLFHQKMLWLKLRYVRNVLMSQLSPQTIQLKEETSGDEIPFLV